ncbi:autotransporter-associated beta strand repeat-containing protein [Haloferula sp. BvORR071]|uniref:beta strand repeat-containing protein n=1 Tax=Haloferula sp. BvORR071 TaxID=1396141 RepID=UPI0005598AE9|nr:autotransporter-associated beta strand repeat-containing protein [Haloferula sp. BvORR071]
MTSHRLRQHLLALTLPAGCALTPVVAHAQSTWNGTTSTAWNLAGNWSPGIPAESSNIIINNTTTNGLTLDANHTIGTLTYGSVEPLRVSGFTLNTQAANTLTINSGLTANGAFTGVGPTFRGNFNIANNQTFTIAGTAGNVTTDAGLLIRGLTDVATTPSNGNIALNGTLTKEGIGQLCIIGSSITGPGSLIANAGALKFNAGGNQAFTLLANGSANVTVNNSASLLISRNSGTFNVTRPIILNNSAGLVFGGNTDNTTFGSDFTFNGTHTVNVSRNFTLTGAITTASSAITRTGGSILNLTGNISGFNGTLINTAGTLTIANAFPGTLQQTTGGSTTVNGLLQGTASVTGGTLTLAGGVSTNVTATGGTLNLTGPADGNVTVTNATLNSESNVGGSLEFTNSTLGINGSTPAVLHTPFDVVINGTVTVALSGGIPLATPFKVLSYDGSIIGDETNFTLAGGANAYRGFTFTNNTAAKSIDLSVNAGAVTWTGAANANWDINTSANWSGSSDKFFQVDAVTFPSVASNKLISIVTTVTPRSITFENELGNDYALSSPGTAFITGTTSITKNGGGVTQLGGANGQNYTGPINVNAGTLRMGSRDAFGLNSGITIASGGQIDINGQTPGTVATGGYTYTISGTGPAPANAGALVNNGVAVNENAGVKNLILAADATLGGVGRFDIGYAGLGGFGTITGNGHTLTVTNTGAVDFRGDASATPINIVANAGTIYAEDNNNAYGGTTGTVTVNAGAKAGTYGVRSIATPVTLNTNGTLHNQGGGVGTWTGTITLAGTGTAFDTNGTNIIMAGTIAETGGARVLTKGNTGATLATLIISGTAANTGNTSITNGWLQIGNGGTTGSINTNPVDLVSATSGLIINRSDDVTIPNVITGLGPAANASNPAALTKYGTGTLTLTGASTYTGATRIDGGAVAIGSNDTVFGTGLLDLRAGTVRASDATARTISNSVSYSANMTLGSATTGNLLFTGGTNVGGGAKAFTVQNAVTEFSGFITGGASTSTLTKDGPGLLIFSNDNNYLQTNTITAGILQVGNGGTTGTLSSTAVINNASLVINRSQIDEITPFTFANNISGTGTLTHSGPANTILSGANTYTGDTIITNGILTHPNANFADTAGISISGTGKLDLTHVGTDTVLKLTLNGAAKAPGVYGATGSGAQFETPLITGTGTLTVTSDGSSTPYSSWATDKGLTGANNAPTANPDQDKYNNLTEFAIDGDPLSGKASGKVVVKVASVGGVQALTLTLPVRTGVGTFAGATALSATGDGVTCTIEGSDTLGASSWTLDIDEVTGADATAIQAGLPALSGAGWTYRTFRSPGAITGDPSDFIRVRVD